MSRGGDVRDRLCPRSESNQLPLLAFYRPSSLWAGYDEWAGGSVGQSDPDGVGLLALIAGTVSYLHMHIRSL
jgi:hypothetical protein